MPRRALCASPPHPGRRCARTAHRVGDDVGHPHAALWAAPGQAVPHRRWAAQATRTMHVGRLFGFWPWTVFQIEILLYFFPNSFQIQTLKTHI
jgi:hypothetical protein